MTTFEPVIAEALKTGSTLTKEQKLLSISPSADDHAALRRVAEKLGWQVWAVKTRWEASERLASQRFALVFCDSTLQDGSWKDILDQIGAGSSAPPLIVTSRVADADLWSEVLNLGGYDVLAKPYFEREVSHVLTTVSLRPAVLSAGM
jgi:CheY-like chemotaxis protein